MIDARRRNRNRYGIPCRPKVSTGFGETRIRRRLAQTGFIADQIGVDGALSVTVVLVAACALFS